MNTVEVLKAARALISDEKNWTQGAFARDKSGASVGARATTAVCYCAIGAIIRAGANEPESLLDTTHRVVQLEALKSGLWVQEFNDRRAHGDVLNLFDSAIARAESEAA